MAESLDVRPSSEPIIDFAETVENEADSLLRMKNLLTSWHLHDQMYLQLQESGFDYYSLQLITESDLTTIFKEQKFIGPLRTFRVKHAFWIQSLTAKTVNTTATSSSSAAGSSGSSETAACPTLHPSRGKKSEIWSVDKILANTEYGVDLSKYYQKYNKFLPEQRKLLIKLIGDHLLTIGDRVSNKKIGELSNEISILFPKESKNDYHDKNGTGLLQVAYNNRRNAKNSKKRQREAWTRENEEDENEEDVNAEYENEDDMGNQEGNLNDEILASVEWLKMCDPNSNTDILIDHWKKSFAYRYKKEKLVETFADKMTEFPFLKAEFGFTLVNYDFEKKHPTANGFKSDWCNFFKKNIDILSKIITDPSTARSLQNIDVVNIDVVNGSDVEHLEIANALHELAPPTSTMWQKKRWKPSIPTSKDCFYQNVEDRNEMLSNLRLHMKNCDKKVLPHFPIIFGITNPSEYVVATSNVIYTFATFLDAMDAAFKCFVFYNIEFPPQVIRFWSVVNNLFYKIDNLKLKLTSSISALLKSFD